MSNQTFQILKELPTPLNESQCVLYKHELLICGGYDQRACYSYHTLKDEYKFICEYPSDVILIGHCVVKLADNNKNNNQITLLSFGSSWGGENKHTLVMKYVSIWSNVSDTPNKSNKLNNYNKWAPLTDSDNHSIIIGRDDDDYRGARTVISGRNNHFVFDLNIFQFLKHDTLPTDNNIWYHCFVSNSENGQGQEMMKTNEKKSKQMLLFVYSTGLLIEYDEDDNIFQFHELPVCDDIEPFKNYAYVCINDAILLFGGYSWGLCIFSKLVHKYLIRENKWMTFQNTLLSPLHDCIAILNEEDNHIYIIGGKNDKDTKVSTHVKTNVRIWDPSYLVMICLFIYFDET
ncbi:hypothetical protein RFI_31336 [Reticulomyxa filosa]|uniref:Kelch motif family protein n=1 Tax=Reticulomyxa filosa TaxID=46433 RepID=X6LY32_RETFI|nr:hypothetical protein RFI_31336 [Reticulomyxa filosa]|eukprot:ETO06062.1 hypothetical protein RFI_31336 [Reticulomyxa filosa]